MATAKKKTRHELEEERKRSKVVLQKYQGRLQVLKQAQEYSSKDDIPRAVNAYLKYLDILASYFDIDVDKLNPKLFDSKNGLAEILLVSQVYWDLAKAFDRAPNLHKESKKCLDQFVLFSTGFKFQFVNSELLRKYIKKKSCYNTKNFEVAYNKLKVQSKKCYVATYAFGNDHPITWKYRKFKPLLMKTKAGGQFVDLYYRFSPLFVAFVEKHPLANTILHKPIKLTLWLFSKVISTPKIGS